MNRNSLLGRDGTGMPSRERSRICEVPCGNVLLPHRGLADAISSNQVFADAVAAELLRGYGRSRGTATTVSAFDHVRASN